MRASEPKQREGEPRMVKVFSSPVRQLNGPLLVMLRECEPCYDGRFRQIPVNRIPIERRTGNLRVVFVRGRVEIPGSGTGNVYPDGATLAYWGSCEIYLEVYPRGRKEKEYDDYRHQAVDLIQMLPTQQTPLAMSERAQVCITSTSRVGNYGNHITLLPPAKLAYYMRGALQLIGVSPGDVPGVLQNVERLLTQGRQRLSEGGSAPLLADNA